MKIRSLLSISLCTMLLFATPTLALTFQEVQEELAGMSCSGSTCTSEQTVVNTVDPAPYDVVNTVDPAPFEEITNVPLPGPGSVSSPTAGTCDGRVGNWARNSMGWCVPASISSPGSSGGTRRVVTVVDPDPYDVVTTVDPDPYDVTTCETTTKEVSWNGSEFDVSSSSSSSDGAC